MRENGYSAIYWTDVGRPDASDLEIIEYARMSDSVIFTNDLDFGTILSITRGRKPSVIQVRASDVRPEIIGEQVLSALAQTEPELEVGALVTVMPLRKRMRILPLFDSKTEAQNQSSSVT